MNEAGKMNSKWGGFIKSEDVVMFDHQFFNISQAEGNRMDP